MPGRRRWTASSRHSSPRRALRLRQGCSRPAAGWTPRWCRIAASRSPRWTLHGDLSGWCILDNSFKPYAACHLTHPAVDAARALASLVAEHGGVGSIRAEIGALAQQITGGKRGEPASPLEGKFDLNECVACGWAGT